MPRIFPRDQLDDMIKHLSAVYPKTFFLDAHLKRPIKRNIVLDLERDNMFSDHDHRQAAISFYTGDWNYESTLTAGAERVDLNGKTVGKVTAQEQREAEKRVQAQKTALREKRKAERVIGPIEVARRLHDAGQISTDSLSKIPAPPRIENTPMPKTTIKTPAPPETIAQQTNGIELTRLRTLWGNIDQVLSHTEDPALRSALIAPALKVFIAEANALIAAMEKAA